MSFYARQPKEKQEAYKSMLKILGMLSGLFSDNDAPYLVSRSQENCFCKYFEADNLGRQDSSADAKKNRIGIGLKTWMGRDDQKVAEFGKLRPQYEHLKGKELIARIAEYRNERIRITKNLNGIDEMIYHIVKRIPGAMQIIEYAFDCIDAEHITILPKRGNANNIYFTDGKHTYHFSLSKNTLYMLFEDMEVLDTVTVDILADPFTFLEGSVEGISAQTISVTTQQKEHLLDDNQICLRLYSESKARGKFVAEKSGLNQWNAGGRARDPDELYIPFPAEDRARNKGFFPPRDKCFTLHLPDGKTTQAKVCQQDSKAIMSNPNKFLGHWLLRDVLELEERQLITYDMLVRFGIDSVVFTKKGEGDYLIDFRPLDTYDRIYRSENFSDSPENG